MGFWMWYGWYCCAWMDFGNFGTVVWGLNGTTWGWMGVYWLEWDTIRNWRKAIAYPPSYSLMRQVCLLFGPVCWEGRPWLAICSALRIRPCKEVGRCEEGKGRWSVLCWRPLRGLWYKVRPRGGRGFAPQGRRRRAERAEKFFTI